MGKISSNYFIKILNIYDNQDIIQINDNKRFVINVSIDKYKSLKKDFIRYKISIFDDFNNKYHKLIPDINNEFRTVVCEYHDHFSFSPTQKLEFSLNLIDEILENRQFKLEQFLTIKS